MRRGWHTELDAPKVRAALEKPAQKPQGVIGIVVAQKFPEPELIRMKLIEGISRVHPDTVWVMRDQARKSHAATVAWETFAEYGIEPFLSELVPAWKRSEQRWTQHIGPTGRVVYLTPLPPVSYDHRAAWRDAEMKTTCERIIVFHDASSGITAEWKDHEHSIAKIYVVERGKKKRAARKGRKPVGA